ncbi:tRNA 2-thiouridine(34) synthase MnmA [Geothrix sp. PMB-07]|uniref:tRNA 2-thiouridine(34) synthase MnmA n=1 Tax=Geothrix sp. PMB-07 TaxID=3068640 RepID=UPI0027411326|nr:tRNA 2-thiouridine(34) synthase MnmA [Geothrix sp. PMB-07]WLT33501.1 tRNA 2-thiouridine(34) synthase MnmA [Geothrix sp. PMB-07]
MSHLLDQTLALLRSHPTLRQGDRILAAMSGGVDSSVMAALLHRGGYEVIGVSMQLFDKKSAQTSDGKCCTLDDFQDARRVAYELGFPHYVMDFESRFRETVIEGFIQGYLNGETPSPCIRCNQHLKFSALMERADSMAAHFVATGHYSTISWDGGKWQLRKAADPAKDQSYFLFHHTQATLPRTLFPLAHLSKPEVRRLGAELGLHLADKPESQEICFVTQDRYDAFLAAEGRDPGLGEGDIRHLDGRVLGQHQGFWRHTVGQRRGLRIAAAEPLYVIRVEAASNTVWVGSESDLMSTDLVAREISWVNEPPVGPLACEARIRSRSPEAEALVIPLPDGRVKVAFAESQRAIAPGQAVVFYRDGEVLGGGWIDSRL